ncbi:MAG TPA: Crp/Fnr family transcriptional regulator [Allosphingosinicella sp.]|uniref:Crp/Fnr family transcriptional regulator n=1 Tax=Allosphingosinicella sp. TaxID=2823234 RepID=UPI002ED9C59E
MTSAAESGDLWGWWSGTAQRRRTLGKDEALFHRGDEVAAMYRVEEGLVRLERRTIDGRLLVLHKVRPGELVAEASLFAAAYHCDAVAAEASVVSLCRRDELAAAMAEDGAMALSFARVIAGQLQSVRHRLEFREVRSATERILLYVGLNADAGSGELRVRGALQDIAAEVGLSREAFYRGMASLERDGLLARRGDIIALRTGA